MRRLVLASTSPYRRQLLEQLEIPFISAVPRFTEEFCPHTPPRELVQNLALGKAASLAATYPDALILGSDQVFVDVDNNVLGKPGDFARAFAQLQSMVGRRNLFHTGVALYDARRGTYATRCCDYAVTLRELSDEQICAYLQRERPFDCAGSFRVEGLGVALMSSMEGDDYTALIGLPLISVVHLLNEAGVDVFLR